MPDLPTPQNAAEAALLSECWDAVLSYADLCTSGSASATQLATEAFTHGIDELRAATAASKSTGTGRRALRLPRIPLLLASVRTVAAAWETSGLGHRLDPDLRLWLHSDMAARYVGPPLHRPLALRGLRDMQEPDAVLLWLAEVESLPMSAVARRLGLDPAAASSELAQVRALFRDHCHRNHLDTPMDAYCRSYARLLDAVTRSPGADADLSRHMARCVVAEAAACLRLHGGGLPAALSSGVIGWGRLASVERRRRAAEAGMIGGRTDAAVDTGLNEGKPVRPRIGRTGILVTAVLVSALALTVSLMPSAARRAATRTPRRASRRTGSPWRSPGPTFPSGSQTKSGSGSRTGTGTTSWPAVAGLDLASGGQLRSGGPGRVLVARREAGRGDGFHEERRAGLPGQVRDRERVAGRLPGHRHRHLHQGPRHLEPRLDLQGRPARGPDVGRHLHPDNSTSPATAADYNKTVAANGTFTFGFLGSWTGSNSAARNFTLNKASCQAAG